jgi:YVTN family beta-propeller protein
MSRRHPAPRAVRNVTFSLICVGILALTLVVSAPTFFPRLETTPSNDHRLAQSSRFTNGTPALVSAGQTALGPPGDTPAAAAFDNRTGEIYVLEYPWELAVLAGNPTSLIDSVFLGPTASTESLAVDEANNTVFVGSFPSTVFVVSGSTHQIVARLALQVDPIDMTYDPATGNVYTGGGGQYLTEINGTSYAVSALGPAGYSGFSPYVLEYDPATGYLVLMGTETCCTGWGWGEVQGIDPHTGNVSWSNSSALFESYSGMAIDGANGSIYLTTSSGGATVLNGSTGATLTNFGFAGGTDCGLLATGMAFDPSSADVLVGECGGVVRSIDTTNDTVGPPVSVGGTPSAIAVNTRSGDAYVLNWDTNSVSVLTANGSAVLRYLTVGGDPDAIAIDSATDTAYVLGSNNVTVLNLTSHSREGSIDVGVNWTGLGGISGNVWDTPQSILYDPSSQEVFVANSGNNTVSVISARTDTVAATISFPQAPLALAWNNETNEIYVACFGLLDVISGSTLAVTANISLGSDWADGIAYDPSLDEIFVDHLALFSGTAPQLTVISAATNSTVGSVPLPSNATTTGQVVYDNITGDLYVAGAGFGFSLSGTNDFIVNPTTGALVANISIGADPNGIAPEPGSNRLFATGGNGTLSVVNGVTGEILLSTSLPPDSYPLGVVYDPSTNQALVVDWGSNAVSYLIPEDVYPVTFSESGLPSGTTWSVTLNGSTNLSASGTLTFAEPNGTYPFTIGGIPGYTVATPTGYVTVNGTNVTVAIRFATAPRETFSVDFTESGLPATTQWAVDFDNVTQSGKAPTIIFADIPNGTYSFTVVPVSNYDISPESGSVTIEGGNQVQRVNFTEIHVPLGASLNWTTVSGTGFCGGAPFSATVQFFGNATGGSPPYTFAWNFGDNASTSTAQNPRYTYTTGPFVAGLAVMDSRGTTVNKSVTLLFTSSCPAAIPTYADALPVVTLVVSLMIAISVGSAAHRITRVKPRA